MSVQELQAQVQAANALIAQTQEQVQVLQADKERLVAEKEVYQKNVFRVSTKLPPFWADKPAVWFSQAEAQFTVNSITTEKTKYAYVVAQLDTRVAAEVEDIITGPAANRTYSKIKETLISRLSISEERRVQQLIRDEEIGDRKPSQFLRCLRSLAGTSAAVSDSLLKQIWLQRLPTTASAILTSQTALELDALATLADRIVEVAPAPVPAVLAVTSKPNDDFTSLTNMIAELKSQIASLSQATTREERPRSRSRSRTPTWNPRNNRVSNMCWFHEKYADKAQKCNPPCSFQQGNAHGNQ